MKQARDTKEKSSESRERGKREEYQPDELRRQDSLLQLQRLAGNRAVLHLMESRGQLQTKLRISEPGDEHEYEADRTAEQVLRLSQARGGMVQRKCVTCTPSSKCSECEEEETRVQRKPKNASVLLSTTPQVQRAALNGNSNGATTPDTVAETAPEPATSTAGPLIVEDDAATLAPGQMRKSEFLEQLRSTVCTTADEALVEAGQSTEGCPYIEQWLAYYEDQEPAHIERALRKYAPEAATATSAHDYIPAVSNRVRRAVATWAETGEITGVPPELAGMLPGAGGGLGAVAGMIGGALSGIGSAIGGAVSAVAGAVGGAFASIGNALFKRKEGQEGTSPSVTNDPAEIHQQLTGGQPLDSAAKSRMSEAFGHDFSGVRIHTNSEAAGLSDSLNARAFTIGSDIAFGPGEYQPGTMIGDALIAHELAHVVQQSGGNGSSAPQSKGAGGYAALEDDADVAAVGAVVSTWGGVKGALADLGRSAMPRMRSGLRLQSCGPEPTPKTPYEKLVVEAAEKMVDPPFGFGFPWELVEEGCDSSSNLEDQHFDIRYWKTAKTDDPKECMLVNTVEGSKALTELFKEENRSRWNMECRIFSELPHLYAMLHILGPTAFDEKFPTVELRRAYSSGIRPKATWVEGSERHMLVPAKLRADGSQPELIEGRAQPEEGAKERREDDVLKEVPVGSRVAFGTYDSWSDEIPSTDNTIKMADDLFAAHDVPEKEAGMYTKEEMIEHLRKKYGHGYDHIRPEFVCIVSIEVVDVKTMTTPP